MVIVVHSSTKRAAVSLRDKRTGGSQLFFILAGTAGAHNLWNVASRYGLAATVESATTPSFSKAV